MLPKTTTGQRARFFEDVEKLLSPGFLSHPVKVAGVTLHVRSLGPGDIFMLRARGEGVDHYEWRLWMVASSIWMINGRTVLGQDSVIPFLTEFLRGMPKSIVNVLFYLILGLFSRAQEAVESVQVYCYEQMSRYKWSTYGGDQAFVASGVPGAAALGTNGVQQIWQAYNTLEDSRLATEQQWEGFKLVASSNAPKAIKKLDTRDQQKRKDEQQRRERELDLFFYKKLGIVTEDGEIQGADGSIHRLKGDKTVEDLEDEMRRWVTEDYDLHDAVVAEYKADIRAKQEAVRVRREAYRLALQKKREEMDQDRGEFKPQPLMAMTAEQLQHMLASKGGKPGVAFLPAPPKADRVFDKYVGEEPDTGSLQVVDGKVVDPSANASTDSRTLNELIKGRSPAFGAGD